MYLRILLPMSSTKNPYLANLSNVWPIIKPPNLDITENQRAYYEPESGKNGEVNVNYPVWWIYDATKKKYELCYCHRNQYYIHLDASNIKEIPWS